MLVQLTDKQNLINSEQKQFITYCHKGVKADVRPVVPWDHIIKAAEQISIVGASLVVAPELIHIGYIYKPIRMDAIPQDIAKHDPEEVKQEMP